MQLPSKQSRLGPHRKDPSFLSLIVTTVCLLVRYSAMNCYKNRISAENCLQVRFLETPTCHTTIL
jgi:hypothetical protein